MSFQGTWWDGTKKVLHLQIWRHLELERDTGQRGPGWKSSAKGREEMETPRGKGCEGLLGKLGFA